MKMTNEKSYFYSILFTIVCSSKFQLSLKHKRHMHVKENTFISSSFINPLKD